jgi:hypothetical protein
MLCSLRPEYSRMPGATGKGASLRCDSRVQGFVANPAQQGETRLPEESPKDRKFERRQGSQRERSWPGETRFPGHHPWGHAPKERTGH